MNSAYNTIIEAILKSEGIDADADEVEDNIYKNFRGSMSIMCVRVFIDACKIEGLKLAANK